MNITLISLTAIAMITLSLLAVSFSSIFYILIGGAVGLLVFLITTARYKNKGGNE
jgi:chromate transporter